MPCLRVTCSCVLLLSIFLIAAQARSDESGALQKRRPFTSGEGAVTVEHCKRHALGLHPPPAMLAACLYVPFLHNAEPWDVKDKPNRLLEAYATRDFRDKIETNRRGPRQLVMTFQAFFSSEGYASLELLGSSFDAQTGIATVRTLNNDRRYDYRLFFVVENGLWRVDDIWLFHGVCGIPQHIKAIMNDPEDMFRRLIFCQTASYNKARETGLAANRARQ